MWACSIEGDEHCIKKKTNQSGRPLGSGLERGKGGSFCTSSISEMKMTFVIIFMKVHRGSPLCLLKGRINTAFVKWLGFCSRIYTFCVITIWSPSSFFSSSPFFFPLLYPDTWESKYESLPAAV